MSDSLDGGPTKAETVPSNGVGTAIASTYSNGDAREVTNEEGIATWIEETDAEASQNGHL